LTISVKKTNITSQDISRTPSISIGDFTLEVVEDFTYPDSNICSNLSLDVELDKPIGKAAKATARQAISVCPILTINTKMQVYRACVLSTLDSLFQ